MTQYVSTRGGAQKTSFGEAALRGLAPDGGLYIPSAWPQFDKETIRSFAGQSYADVAKTIIAPFVGDDVPKHDLDAMIDEAYGRFHHDAVCPLVQIEANDWILELFHGPTLAFKDVAMCLLGPLMDYLLAQRNDRATIVVATSGDTGSAAVEAFKNRERTDLYVLLPKGRTSEVQRRQMTTGGADNVHALIIDGTFDDCQALVKSMFNHEAFRAETRLSGVNSINWARIVAQSVYYFTSAVALGAPDRRISYSVPTGNFGDIYAAEVARQMGLPLGELIVASNQNDILPRTFETGRYEATGVEMTQSPSMDIQVSSNFERLLYGLTDCDADRVRGYMQNFSQSKGFDLGEDVHGRLKQSMRADRTSEIETAAMIKKIHQKCAYLLDPHTAVGYDVALKQRQDKEGPLVTLATAHPAKFPDAVKAASGQHPDLPPHLADLYDRTEVFTQLPNDLQSVEAHIRATARILKG